MNARLRQLLNDPRKFLLATSALAYVLLLIIIALLIMLMRDPVTRTADSSNDLSGGKAEVDQSLSGKTEKLFGKTVSLRNLKGLTLRIHQIETCSASGVSAYVGVSTDEGVVNTKFKKADVKVYVDGKEVTDFDFSPVNTNTSPISNVLVIDHSGSMTTNGALNNAKAAATQYIQKLKASDQAALVQFDDRVETLVAMTQDKAAVVSSIATIQPRGDTAIYDALDQAIGLISGCGRKAVTILTDGDDTASKTQSQTSVIDRANKANLPIFSVGVKGLDFNPTSIKNISAATGGQYLEANTPAEIGELYDRINGQLSGQFVANLRLKTSKTGAVHTLKIISTVEGSPTSSERSFIY